MARSEPLSPLRVGAFQFAASDDVTDNVDAIERGAAQAARRKVRLLVLQECALTGYPGVERKGFDRHMGSEVRMGLERIGLLAERFGLYIAVGTPVFNRSGAWNALVLVDPEGETVARYYKRALYGEDAQHFRPGLGAGQPAKVEGWRVGLRVCFDFRFPEYFRELLLAKADLCVMGFCMSGDRDRKRDMARAHLMSRAAENGFPIVAANSATPVQNAPSLIVDADGKVLAEAPADEEALIVHTLRPPEPSELRERIRSHAAELAK